MLSIMAKHNFDIFDMYIVLVYTFICFKSYITKIRSFMIGTLMQPKHQQLNLTSR